MKTKYTIVSVLMFLVATVTQAQINIQGSVFGGARQANVGGETNVNIGAEKHDVIINAVFGGNDISGIVGEEDEGVDAHVTTTENGKKLFIGQLFGGGNGDYIYKDGNGHDLKDSNDKYIVKNSSNQVIATSETAFTSPVLGKVNLNLGGGTFGYVYGGGNNATVSQLTFITINNTSNPTPVTQILNVQDGTTNLLTTERLRQMGINTAYYNQGTEKFLFSRVFGGNNKAPMAIRPTWELQAGSIENLYSGGNEGKMTSPVGLLLEIDPKVPDNATAEDAKAIKEKLIIDNVFGGCRKADVQPDGTTGSSTDDNTVTLDGYHFPKGLSARVLVRGGKINNVYGGNDVKGRVYGGNAVGVYTSISGNIYGGGNGSYPYTDNSALEGDLLYGDFYYNPETVLSQENVTASSGMESVTALNLTRPNAEQVSISVRGTATEPTVIGGAIYCGGNSATLKKNPNRQNPRVELKIGSYMIADKVFLGNNGENMIKYTTETDLTKIKDEHVLNRFKQYVVDGNLANEGTSSQRFNSIDLTDGPTFAKYMDGCALDLPVKVKFIGDDATDDQTYKYDDYTSYIGSFYCGGNVGSMTMSGKSTINFDRALIVYSKVVGGCNNAYVQAHSGLNAAYQGGIIGSEDERGTTASNHYTANGTATGAIKDRLELNFGGLKIQPLRMPENGVDKGTGVTTPAPYIATNVPLVWNTIKLGERDDDGNPLLVAWNNSTWNGTDLQSTMNRRFNDGNIYGGCCQSGIVNGNVIININQTVVDRTGEYGVFDEVELDGDTGEEKLYNDHYRLISHKSGVILGQQGMDVLGSALNIFGGGKGLETEIWGSATINLNEGYVFQIFGGSEQGAIGKRTSETKDDNGRYTYTYDSRYSTYVNLHGKEGKPGVSKAADGGNDPELAEAEFLYGGGFEGPIAGDTHITLNNGRIFNSFAGSCNADIQGHTETYIGVDGFPYVRDYVYGGNDLGGEIIGDGKFWDRVRDNATLQKVHGYNAANADKSNVLNASAYIEYIQGRVEKIFGGCYGVYDYTDPLFGKYFYDKNVLDKDLPAGKERGQARDGYCKPKLDHAFINFRPMDVNNPLNTVGQIYGAGQGILGEKEENKLQNSSYILIDIPQTMKNFTGTAIFGAGECGGVGMYYDLSGANPDYDKASAIIDLLSGEVKATYGGSYKEGITRRTVVNVPTGSTIAINSIFGGAYGTSTYYPCDVYEANVNYWGSENAKVTNAIYGGNNNERRTIYGKVNIYGPVYSGSTSPDGSVKYTSTVYGAGHGMNTWSEYTEVNLEAGASVYEVYGGGEAGKVHNAESVQHYMNTGKPSKWPKEKETDPDVAFTDADWKYAWTLGGGYDPTSFDFSDIGNNPITTYVTNDKTNLNNSLVRTAEMDDRTTKTYKYNTNVLIKQGASVGGYAYGGGLGEDAVVAGTTYIALLGGKVTKDLYAAGTSGSVEDLHQAKNFTASANAYIEGGSARNVYGGGWKGSVGQHVGDITAAYITSAGELIDIPGETHVVIGKIDDGTTALDYFDGLPAIERNAYGGGEGGAVWGTANITLNNGFIGYRRFTSVPTGTERYIKSGDDYYQEKIIDETYTDEDGHFQANKRLDDAGCIFGGGYIDNSSVDFTNVTMYGGHVRNALFGGGEIAAIGRGKIQETTVDGKAVRSLVGIYRPGKTLIEMFDGHVHRNVFGGGRGYNNLGEGGKLFSDGYVFGQTLVHIHGGEIGTEDELLEGNGNVFGGGDIGYVYSAYEYDDGNGHKLPRKGVKSGVRYDGDGMYQGYYYEHVWENTTSTETNFIHYTDGIEDPDGDERKLTEDCKVLIAPHCKVTADDGITLTIKYEKGQVVSAHDLSYISTHPELSSLGIDAFGKVTANGGISFARHYDKGQYVQTSALHTLGNRVVSATDWGKLESNTNNDGIIIHNAVFAGGNTSSKGSDDINAYANSTSVYGNATASIHDVYHRDLITIGTGHIGGLYGDGNLTFVDGYRGLNITNYGTDYNYLYEEESMKELTKTQYDNLLDREKDYYELRYKCVLKCTDDDGTNYFPVDKDHTKASTLTADDILTLFAKQPGMFTTDGDGHKVPNPTYWAQNGVCSIYAGRILNTIQRADFCGVFGSRLVLQGAQDRVPEVVDYTKYTINRVREVSLNRKNSVRDEEADTEASADKISKRKMHGNYFGIYNIVNYLGALTSDFDFGDQGTSGAGSTDAQDAAGRVDNGDGTFSYYTSDVGSSADVRTSDNINTGTYGPQYTGQTFYGWKRFHHDDQTRNNGNSHNKVALASGVYLELTTEESIGKELNEKVWGLITGVVELDLINVQQGMGGGFVYAKNVHGVRTKTNLTNTTLTALNAGAVTRWDYTYAEPSLTSDAADPKQREWQTSGNFVHSTQTIIDDCYNISNRYKGPNQVPAHYWYIKGSVYVYDQYISAYTGATNAYSEVVDIPLTITAASHGNMRLLNVQPNLYAYKNTNGQKLSSGQKLLINDIEYTLNTPISYWDWYKLTAAEKNLFVPETYISVANYKYTSDATEEFSADEVMLPTDYDNIKTHAHHMTDDQGNEVKDENNKPILQLWDIEKEKYVLADSIIRSSNNLSHDTGYILTYKVNNPTDWDTWYTEYFDSSNDKDKQREKDLDKGALRDEMVDGVHKGPNDGPTYRLISNTGALLGQRDYKVSDLVSEDVVTTYQAIHSSHIPSSGQAVFSRAFVATGETDITRMGQTVHLYKGSTMSATEASGVSNVIEALICTKTIRLSSTDNIYINSVMTQAEKTTHLSNVNTAINTLIGEINTIIGNYNTDHPDNTVSTIDAATFDEMGDLTSAQQNIITALQRKELSDLLMRKKDITNNIVPAYYCTTAGRYGGNYYESGINYRGLEAWSSMDEKDRAQFTFNYDALDLLIDPTFPKAEGEKYQYDSAAGTLAGAEANPAGYSLEKPVDYTATYNGDGINLTTYSLSAINVKRGNVENYSTTTIQSGDELSRTVFEGLPNEQRHYTPLTVTSADVAGGKTCTFYVVKTPLLIGPTPYTTGNLISKDDFESLYPTVEEQNQQNDVIVLPYTASGTYYFCRDAYTPPTGSDETVTGQVGSVISSDVYKDLINLQKNFTIHGIAPTETSTLYVSRFSDIDDLSKEKIITVIYEYDYEESDVLGLHITPVTERHVLNIHINFKTGAPIVEDIEAPQIILPGNFLPLIPPHVIEGASPIQGGGWELYPTESDADNHNGIEYIPDIDPLYWYQHGYYLRYYALSHVGGKTYSNKVQVSVANYHDLKKVMEDKDHHYYVDIPNLNRLRESKIYINDADNGAQQLKDLFNLSLLTTAPTSGTLAGHSLLDPQVKACGNLEFIMRTNVNHTGSWTSIGGGSDPCFEGVFHGDGHYISGLSESLFGKLCGEVYNLGVMGSFTSAGIADTGDGYVENCWVKSSATSGWANDVQAVFGQPTRAEYTAVPSGTKLKAGKTYYTSSTGGGEFTATGNEQSDGTNYFIKRSTVQLVNSYYPIGNNYKVTENANRGAATQMPVKAFYNGEVAYDLNGFYLYKRYRDHSGLTSTDGYKYFTIEDLAETTPTPTDAYYGTTDTKLSSSGAGVWNKGYVEDRYADGDFRYAGGEIPTEVDERLYIDNTVTTNKTKFYPIWPDDYIFFGQMLSYDWDEQRPHEEVPSSIVKESGRLTASDKSNRVYRAPAYYGSKVMGSAHFNPDVNLVAQSKPRFTNDTEMKDAYPGMTAIDFAGHNDLSGGYKLGLDGTRFYPPLLDDDGLRSIVNTNETPNLVVYAPAATAPSNAYANQKTYTVLNNYFTEPVFNNYYDGSTSSNAIYNDSKDYNRVYAKTEVGDKGVKLENGVHGHLVQSGLTTTNDHLLVDKKDFNCPIAYHMGTGKRMWYQRIPDTYVEPIWSGTIRTTKGWESVSLPFTAELVTTVKKGEITHFYEGSAVSKNGTKTKIGHEYWLRKYRDINPSETNGLTSESTAGDKAWALFTYPGKSGDKEETMDKEMKNSFLWDYYYMNANATAGNTQKDKNGDDYLYDPKNPETRYKDYYKPDGSGVVNTFKDYALLTKAIPYLIGFPGKAFYEFDLSGNFDATTTADDNPDKVLEKTITFASKASGDGGLVTIGVSDDETKDGVSYEVNGVKYIFKPSYMNQAFAAATPNTYTLSADGSSYDLIPTSGTTATEVYAFRPYFTSTTGSGARNVTRTILFSNDNSELQGVEEKGDPNGDPGTLRIYSQKHKIVVESALTRDIDVRIVNAAGITVTTFNIEPGETIETRINNAGVYIVQSADGRYIKKLAVR